MTDMDKCFRCGMYDIDNGVGVCRMEGHRIDQPLSESCENIVQVDRFIDSQQRDMENFKKNCEFELDTFGGDLILNHAPPLLMEKFKEMRKSVRVK